MAKLYALFVGSALLLPPGAVAQSAPELVTDRPDFTESPVTVPRGSLQLELGSTWERRNGVNTVNAGEGLVRWGLLEALELRFGLPEYMSTDGVSGTSDASLGAKLALGRVGNWEAGLLGAATLPTGDEVYGADGTNLTLALATGLATEGSFSMGNQLALTKAAGRDGLGVEGTTVFGLAISDRVAAFAEVALSSVEPGRQNLLLHHGYSFLVGPTLQVDIHGGLGLDERSADGFAGVGLSIRFGP